MKISLLPFIIVSHTVLWHSCRALGVPFGQHDDGSLAQIPSFLGPPSAETDDQQIKSFLRHSRMSRLLLQEQDGGECPDFVNAGIVYQQTVLGPANASDSLFNNIKLPNNESLDVTLLADYLIFPLYIDQSEPTFVQENQYFGRNGEVTNVVMQQHNHLTVFWNLPASAPVFVVGVHSEALQDTTMLPESVRVCCIRLYGYDPESLTNATLNQLADEVRTAIEEEVPGHYSNPGLTLMAFYWHHPEFAGYEDASVISMDDGLLELSEAMGMSKEVGASILHAWLFSFHNQFVLDLEDNDGNLTKYEESTGVCLTTELEANAMTGYALAHNQGGNWSVDMLQHASHFLYWNGDCEVEDECHLGTPSQNECATAWGADEGLHALGDPASMREFRELFRQNLDLILALDPSVCNLTDSAASTTSASGERSCSGAMAAFVMLALAFLLS